MAGVCGVNALGWSLRPAQAGIQIVFRRDGQIAVLGLYPDAVEARRRLRKKIQLYRPDGRRLPPALFHQEAPRASA